MHLACIPSGITDDVASETRFEAVFPTSRAGTEQGEIYLCCSIAIEPRSWVFSILQDSELLVTGSIMPPCCSQDWENGDTFYGPRSRQPLRFELETSVSLTQSCSRLS